MGEIGIVTGSRDTTIKIWAEESATAYGLINTLVRQMPQPGRCSTTVYYSLGVELL